MITVLTSCGPSRYARLSEEHFKVKFENEELLQEISELKSAANRSRPRYSANGSLVRNINGTIVAKSKTKTEQYFFYIRLENNKELIWPTTQSKYAAKQRGDAVYFEYVGKYRFNDNLKYPRS
jgi:hypothetical protein